MLRKFICDVYIPDHCAQVYIERRYVEASGAIYVGTSGDEKILNCNAVAELGYAKLIGNHFQRSPAFDGAEIAVIQNPHTKLISA